MLILYPDIVMHAWEYALFPQKNHLTLAIPYEYVIDVPKTGLLIMLY